MKVLVTGGTGFVGSALIKHLLENNYEVRVLAHHKKNRFFFNDFDVEMVDGNILHPGAVEKAIKGCSIVFNLASVYTFYPFWEKDPKALYKINVQGTTNILAAALQNKVQRFIHTSTVATIGKNPKGTPSDENTAFDFKNSSHYARSKYLAEQEVLRFCEKGLPVVILNPAIVIGGRDYKPTPSGEIIVNFLNRRYPGYFKTTWAVADADDVAKAHIAALKHGRIGERYILCNKKHLTLKEIFKQLEEISKIKSPRIKIPYPLLLAFVYIDELLSYCLFKKKPIMPSEGVKFCRLSTIYSNSKALNELKYTSTPIKETLAKAVSWYRNNGYIEPRGVLRFKIHGSKKVKFFMQKLKMHKYTDRLSLGTFIFFSIVSFLQFLEKIGVKSSQDGWRKVTQSYLRTEHSKFILTAFRLDFQSDLSMKVNMTLDSAKAHLIARLSHFIRQQPTLHWQLQWHRFYAKQYKKSAIDIAHVTFEKNGALKAIDPHLDNQINDIDTLSEESKNHIIKDIVKAYNKTRNLNDRKRPLILKKILKQRLSKQFRSASTDIRLQAKNFVDRILSATFIHFEKLPHSNSDFDIDNKRIQTPCFIKAKHAGFGLLNILCRFTHDFKEADLWIQYSHIPIDGVPMQEVLGDLKKKWGKFGIFKLPSSSCKKKTIPELCSTKSEKKSVYSVNQVINFNPFLKLRKRLNKYYTGQGKGNVTVAALLMWRLSQYTAFENIKFAIPVDVRSSAHRERTLGFVFIRPSVYFDRYKPDKGFYGFQQEFNRQLKATRKRRSESYKLLESYTLFPPAIYSATLKLLPSAVGEFVGTVGITIIKKADLFIGPSNDIHIDGFIAINNLFTPTQEGDKVCDVSIKAPKDKITDYLDAITQAVSLEEK